MYGNKIYEELGFWDNIIWSFFRVLPWFLWVFWVARLKKTSRSARSQATSLEILKII